MSPSVATRKSARTAEEAGATATTLGLHVDEQDVLMVPPLPTRRTLSTNERPPLPLPLYLHTAFTRSRLGHALETSATGALFTAGFLVKYTGVCFLMAGSLHFVWILMTVPLAPLVTQGAMTVIMALMKSGALPTIGAGAAMHFAGSSFMKGEGGLALSTLFFGLPFWGVFNALLSLNPPPIEIQLAGAS